MASWKIVPEPSDDTKIEYTPFLQSRKYFAVDDSGSTAGSILRRERTFVDALQANYANTDDAISLWGSNCDIPTKDFATVRWISRHGGTQPSTILKRQPALDAVRSSDVWFLLTDGEIWDGDVTHLAELALTQDILNVPLVFLITGSPAKTPSMTNISVGISFFASCQDTLILFKETGTGKIYVIAGKGCFASLGGSAAAQDLESWHDLQLFEDEADFFAHCERLEVHVVQAETRTGSGKGVSLGSKWEEQHKGPVRVDLDLLPGAGLLTDDDLFGLLAEEAFDTLAVAYKTRSRIAELRAFLQKQKVEQVALELKDVAGAAGILIQLNNANIIDAERKDLQVQLRAAHARNREHYQKTVAEFLGSEEEQNMKSRNQIVDAALRSLASIEAAGFNADILSRKSNRARRAEVVDTVPALDTANLDFDTSAYRGFCLVCCGEEEVMSICFKELESEKVEDNTTDFALNFPLAAGASVKNVNIVSSQNICFQCASLAPEGRSIYNEGLTTVIPIVQYEANNKKYINDQLYSALTARLATGAAGIAQLFVGILLELLRTKPWAGAGMEQTQLLTEEQQETNQRRNTFQWMLDQLMQNTWTREDFKEAGAWVKFPQALTWAEEDFEKNGLASFVVTYPMAGFDNLVALGVRTREFSEILVRRIKSAKAVHSIAAKYLAELQVALQAGGHDEQWKQKYLRLIYQDFNGTLVPRDQGAASLVTCANTFYERLTACIGTATLEDNEGTMRKVQLILFWLLFSQKGHCTAQTFFTRLRETEPIARAVLDPRLGVPEAEACNILLSIFAIQEAELINPSEAAKHSGLVPFSNPFGASVLHCGAEGCKEVFCTLSTAEKVNGKSIYAIRDARTKHLIDVFGIKTRFEKSITGLPERADTGRPPTSIHTNLHISISREWAKHTSDQRRTILADKTVRKVFVTSVRKRLCTEGRGNIFQDNLDHDTRILLPSFFAVLKVAMEKQGRSGEGVEMYEHDFEENTLEGKVRWEMQVAKLL